jgi:GTPase
MLIDEVDITIRGGHGGPGKVSFGKVMRSGPDGGNGGKGGDVYIVVTSDLFALRQFSKEKNIEAQNGAPGEGKRKSGLNGNDLEIKLPVGTTLTDLDTGEEIELNVTDQRILICEGGLGGRGNFEFKSSRRTTPTYAQPGLPGDYKRFKATLKFLAEYGLVGLPNAGKSSLLNELTNAKAGVGNYPFTTLETNLGVFNEKIIADIPGLIEGASEGKGLGHKFLRHIEKVKIILHCIAADSENVLLDYETVNKELGAFDKSLIEKDKIILLTKKDLVGEKDLASQITRLKKLKFPVVPVSIHDWDSISKLKEILASV